jgi:hypothetical protein
MFRVFRTGATLALVATLSACLSTSHRISRDELANLARTAPAARGERVQVLQTFAGDEPPAAPRGGGGVYVGVGVSTSVGHSHSRPRGGSAARMTDKGKWWFLVAALAAVGFAASEGARYDGWVRVTPAHPLHLYGPSGEYTWIPLGSLSPDQAAWASRAYLRQEEGPWTTLGRRPLDRRGFTYSVLGGASEFPSEDLTERPGFLGHIQFGYHPAQQLGILFDVSTGWTENGLGDAVFDLRNALELQLFPLTVGILHAGVYGQIGLGTRWEDGYHEDDDRSTLWSVGPLLQLELTTRLAITGRAGLTGVYGARASEFGIGLSVY